MRILSTSDEQMAKRNRILFCGRNLIVFLERRATSTQQKNYLHLKLQHKLFREERGETVSTLSLSVIPVSYTHLDVYKRQEYDCVNNEMNIILTKSECDNVCVNKNVLWSKPNYNRWH